MPLFWFCLTVIIGIVISSFFALPPIFWFSGEITSLVAGVFELACFNNKEHTLISRPLFRIPFAFLFLGFFLGGLRFQSALPQSSPNNILSYISDEPITLIGVINSDPIQTNSFSSAVIKSETITLPNKKISVQGKIFLVLPAGFNIRYGDRLQLHGKLYKTYENESLITKSSFTPKKIFARMSFPDIQMFSAGNGNRIMDFIYRFRERAHSAIFKIMPFPESAVLSGILLGIDSEIPEYLLDGYRASGTIHIIVISGFNITIISLLAFRIFRLLFGSKLALPAAVGAILFYVIFVGADPPVVRAAIMGILVLTSYQIGRRAVGIYSLMIAAAVMLFGNPFLLWSISFQLSFIATLTLLTMIDPITEWMKNIFDKFFSPQRVNFLMPVLNLWSTTFLATLMIFPILFKLNPGFSTISLAANLLILPLQPLIMIVGGLAVIFGFFIPVNINIFGMIAWPLIAFCNQIAIRLSLSNAAQINLPEITFWISLITSILVLSYFSLRSIYSLSHFEK